MVGAIGGAGGVGGGAGMGMGAMGVGSVGAGAGGEGLSVGGVGSQGQSQSNALGNVSAPQSGHEGVKVSFSQAAKSFGEPTMPGVQMADWNQMMLQNMEKMSDLVALALLALMNKDRQ